MTDSKLVFITHPYYAVNNPTNNYRIYFKKKNSDKWYYVQCKDKNDYRIKINEYIGGFINYVRDENKAHHNLNELKNDNSMLKYFMGSKKDEELMHKHKMKKDEMAMLKDGTFLKEKDVAKIQHRWSNYIEDSNIQLTVLSLNQDYVDENISIKELHKKITTDVMPKFLRYCGYENPEKNLEWIVALHADRENNYHFHISWVEKNKCYLNSQNQLTYKWRLKLNDKEINFIKRQTSLTIEREKLYKPALIKLGNQFEDLKQYFNPKDNNFTLRNIDDLILEEKIVKLGFLLNQIKETSKTYIKYNSLPRNQLGNEIRNLTQEIKKEIFKNDEIKGSRKQIYKSIDKINDILLDIDKRNNISNIGFETAFQNKMIQDKLEKNENYILNAIANHALYNFDFHKTRIKKDNFTLSDIIQEVAYQNYMSKFKDIKSMNTFRKIIVKNSFRKKTGKKEIIKTLDKLNHDQEKIAKQFYEMFEENNYDKAI